MADTAQAAQNPAEDQDFQVYVDRARELQPYISKFREEQEKERFVHPKVVDAIKEAGLFQLPKPRSAGGIEAPLSIQFEVLRLISQANISASWIMMACGAHAHICGTFSKQLHDEINAEDPHWILAGGSAPLGKAVPCDGGWKLSGNLPFASGIDHATWTIAGAQVEAGDRKDLPPVIMTFIPKRDLEIKDNWYTMGLRGTGSKMAVANEVFVPEHQTMPIPTLVGGKSPHAESHATFLHRLPLNCVMTFYPTGTILGASESMLENYVDMTRVRKDKHYGSNKAENAGLQFRIAETNHKLYAARSLVRDIAARLDRHIDEHTRPNLEGRGEFRSACAYGIQMAREAVDHMFAGAGANACYDTSPLQQAFRDINVGSHHGTADYDTWMEQYGRMRLGLDPTKIL